MDYFGKKNFKRRDDPLTFLNWFRVVKANLFTTDFLISSDSLSRVSKMKKAPKGILLFAEMFEYFYQMVSDHFCISPFDVVPFDKVNQFAVFEQCHGWRRRRVG